MDLAAKILVLAVGAAAAVCWVKVHIDINRGYRPDWLFIVASALSALAFFGTALLLLSRGL